MSAAELVAARGLGVRFGRSPTLWGIDFKIEAREIVTILGPNGSGKTTLLRALLGILPLSEGQVERQRGLRIGYVPQRLALDASLPLSVGRFLSLPRRVDASRARASLARTGLPDGIEGRPMASLSGGQFQRVMLARALLGEPQLLALDEPTQGLDQPGAAGFYRLIDEIRAETGCAVLMVSHDLNVVMAASDRVICINGHICCQGAPSAVATTPEYRSLFGLEPGQALAFYRHQHDHAHDLVGDDHRHDHDHDHHHDHGGATGHAAPGAAEHAPPGTTRVTDRGTDPASALAGGRDA